MICSVCPIRGVSSMEGRGGGGKGVRAPKDVSSITSDAARLFSAAVCEQVCDFMKSG